MRIPSNRLHDIRAFFLFELQDLYENFEAESLFYWACEEILGENRSYWRIRLEQTVSESILLKFNFTVKDLKKGRPIQYIFQKAYFGDLTLYVDESVLIPRPETEELLQWILQETTSPKNILDICSGSGCLALALQKHFRFAKIKGLDISKSALNVAQRNAKNLELPIEWMEADILETIPNFCDKFDIIVSNPPYVRESEKVQMHTNVKEHEPALALFVSDEDPLLFYRAIAHFSHQHLNQKGSVYVEINEAFEKETAAAFAAAGFQNIETRKDLQGKARMLRAY